MAVKGWGQCGTGPRGQAEIKGIYKCDEGSARCASTSEEDVQTIEG